MNPCPALSAIGWYGHTGCRIAGGAWSTDSSGSREAVRMPEIFVGKLPKLKRWVPRRGFGDLKPVVARQTRSGRAETCAIDFQKRLPGPGPVNLTALCRSMSGSVIGHIARVAKGRSHLASAGRTERSGGRLCATKWRSGEVQSGTPCGRESGGRSAAAVPARHFC